MKALNLLHIVRHYGPVGGMERYVWELSRELADMGHTVTVLCEQLQAEKPHHVRVIELGNMNTRRRWIRHLKFSSRVSDWIEKHPDEDRIVHSHERTGVHHFTTFHGPPFATVKNKPLWQRLSPRIYANLWLERRELCGPQVKAVIPNSTMISNALLEYYPDTKNRLVEPIVPGVPAIPARGDRTVSNSAGIIGFVGKEWKRKGLDMAVQIVSELRKQRPELQFMVAGPEPDKIRHLFQDWHGGFELLGETDSTPLYAQMDLLLHPARAEPYGMVIAEARAAGVPVLVSDACGIASELEPCSVMPADSPVTDWLNACQNMIGRQPEIVARSWRDAATEQVACYRKFAD